MATREPSFPALETKRLILRPLEDDDADFVFRHFSDPDVARHLLDSPPLTTRAEARELIEFYRCPEPDSPNRWCIERKADHTAIGTCGYHHWTPRHHRAEIGYDLDPSAWSQGYMREALRAALGHGFERMRLNRVDALVFAENRRSIRLLERLGFQSDGVLREYFCSDGEFFDHTLYSLLQREWRRSDVATA